MLPPWLELVRKNLERVLSPAHLPHKIEKGQEQVLSEKQQRFGNKGDQN
jgi:hypothetical protein